MVKLREQVWHVTFHNTGQTEDEFAVKWNITQAVIAMWQEGMGQENRRVRERPPRYHPRP